MSWTDTIFKFLGRARFNTITPNASGGDLVEAQCDASGRLLVNTQSINTLWSDAGASVAEKVIKATPGKLHQIFGRNTGGVDLYIFLFDHAQAGVGTRPANTSTAELFAPIKVKAGEHFSIDLARPRAFNTGLYWGVSSTDGTFTYEATGAFAVAAEYE